MEGKKLTRWILVFLFITPRSIVTPHMGMLLYTAVNGSRLQGHILYYVYQQLSATVIAPLCTAGPALQCHAQEEISHVKLSGSVTGLLKNASFWLNL